MAFFGKKSDGGLFDVIRCDEDEYLIWKWSPNLDGISTSKQNSIRWGSSLRVKDGEVAVFVYKQENGPSQDYIEGPFDETIKTANFPVLSNILGLAFNGTSPFQAEIYFINLAGNIRQDFRVPYFDVADPRFADFPLRVTAQGSYVFNITDYKGFIKLHRLITFEMDNFKLSTKDAVHKFIKGVIVNVPIDNNISVLQIERKLLEINDLITPRLKNAFIESFGVNLKRFDLSIIEVEKNTDQYEELRKVTAALDTRMLEEQNNLKIKNLKDTQEINDINMRETLNIQREQAARFAKLQTESQFLGAHQINKQTEVLVSAAQSLGDMGQINTGGGSSGGGFNPIGMMTGLAVGGVMGSQMAGMMSSAGQGINQSAMAPPPIPVITYFVSINGQNTGPFDIPHLLVMAQNLQLNTDTYVWKQGMSSWELAGQVTELSQIFSQTASPPQPPPPPN
jgi:membrane protease subunit (stomatin/prohibitin family)